MKMKGEGRRENVGRVDVEGGIGRDVREELLQEAEPSMFSVEVGTEQFEADKDDQRIWLVTP